MMLFSRRSPTPPSSTRSRYAARKPRSVRTIPSPLPPPAQLSDGRGDLPATPRDSSGLTAALALERITRVLRAVHGVRRLDFHFLRAPPDWVADLPALLAPLYGSLEELKVTVASLSPAQAASLAAVIASPDTHLARLEIRTTLPLGADAAVVLADALRANLALAEILLTHVEPADEEAVLARVAAAVEANTARAAAASALLASGGGLSARSAGGGASARSTGGLSLLVPSHEVVPSHELRAVVGGRHKLFTVAF